MPDDEYNDEPDLDLDEDEEAFLAAWEAIDNQAAAVLADACQGVMSQPPPSDEVRRAAAKLRDNVRTGSWPFGYFAAGLWLGRGSSCRRRWPVA